MKELFGEWETTDCNKNYIGKCPVCGARRYGTNDEALALRDQIHKKN